MSILAKDPNTQLAFSVYENPGIFVALLGSGLSRSAEIPTGWEITLDLIRRVALLQGTGENPDWAQWYRDQTGQEPNYSALLEELAASPDERRSILHSYIEPTDRDREEGKKIPTPAHESLADLVREGYVRLIITTNFDRLMENALRERGVEPTIVASVDALKGAEPIAHSACYILKLHGDYKDARILNTDEELSGYPEAYTVLLDRIFDEYGLIVCGWSGEWDHALRAALLRAPNRRYPVYWAARGTPGTGAQEIIAHRGARLIEIDSADSFFTSLRQKIQTLEQTHRQNPLGVELLVSSAKRYLSKQEYRIQLDELFSQEAGRLVEQLDSSAFTTGGPWSQEDFRKRIALYEAATEPLARMAGVLGRWGGDNDLALVLDILRVIRAHAEKATGGLVAWAELRDYPAVLIFTAYGLGLARARRWQTLHRLLTASISGSNHDPQRVVETFFLWAWAGGKQDWKRLEGLEAKRTPLSEHLLDIYKEWGSSFAGIVASFEELFELFEILASLTYAENSADFEFEEMLDERDSSTWAWMPVGRSGWHGSTRNRLLEQILSGDLKGTLLKAGFGKGSEEFLERAIKNYRLISARKQW